LAKLIPDQADGLRKLVGHDGLQVISILSGHYGAGKTVAATNLASALTRAGRRVKVVDSPITGRLQSMPMQGQSAHALADATPDIILVDTPSGDPGDYPNIDRSEIVIVLQPDSKSITSGYGLLKQLSGKYGIDRFHILLNRVTDIEGSASIARNFSDAAGRFLGVSVCYLGHIPRDSQLEKADRLKKSVVDAFPIAESARQFRQMADKLVSLPRLSSLSEMGDAMQRIVMSAAC
jgi:flagellar biosynthesis protein FlhG